MSEVSVIPIKISMMILVVPRGRLPLRGDEDEDEDEDARGAGEDEERWTVD